MSVGANIDQIVPGARVARQAQIVMADDYRRIGLSVNEAETMSGLNDVDRLSDLTRRMETSEREYYGHVTDRTLDSFASLGNWHYGDVPGFQNDPKIIKGILKALETIGTTLPVAHPSTHDGIFAFSIARTVEFEETASELMSFLIDRSRQRGKAALRTTVDMDDLGMRKILKNHEARPVGLLHRVGKVTIGDISREYGMYEMKLH